MTTHGTNRLRRSLDNQRGQGAMTYAMPVEDMEALVREVEDERDALSASAEGWATRCSELMRGGELPARATVVETVKNDSGYRFVAVFTDHDRAMEFKAALEEEGEYVWLTHHAAVNPAMPDSWAAIERDARTIDGACTDLMSAADLVARCKKLAGVE